MIDTTAIAQEQVWYDQTSICRRLHFFGRRITKADLDRNFLQWGSKMYNEQRLVTLIVDDDPYVVEFIEDVLLSANCDVHTAKDGEHALQQANACRPDLVFLDIRIPEQDGWLVCTKLKLQSKAPRVVLMTGYADDETVDFAKFVDADELLKKPFSEEDVLRVVNEACLTVSTRRTLQV